MIRPFAVEVVQLATSELSPVTHSALISVYTCTECEPPSLALAETDKYEKGRDCLTRSVGWSRVNVQKALEELLPTHLDRREECNRDINAASGKHEF